MRELKVQAVRAIISSDFKAFDALYKEIEGKSRDLVINLNKTPENVLSEMFDNMDQWSVDHRGLLYNDKIIIADNIALLSDNCLYQLLLKFDLCATQGLKN